MNKRGVELGINTIIIIILTIIVLIVLLLIFSEAMRDFTADLFTKLKNALNLWNATQIK